MVDRRTFLKNTALAATAASGLLSACETAFSGNDKIAGAAVVAGQVPATLDLAHHGDLAINGLLGSLDPARDYECAFLNILDVHPAYMLHWSTMVSGVMPKYVEALPMMRLMSGSRRDLDIEKGFYEAMQRNAAQDGLIYDRALPSRPWNVGVYYGKKDWNEDYANMAGNGRYIAGLLFNYQVTGDEAWMRQAERTAERMLELAIIEGDKGWYPEPGLGNDFSYPRVSGWTTKKPPEKANEGFEGASMFYLCQPLRGWARYYAASGDERFLELSRKFVNCAVQGKFWSGAADMSPGASAERGHFHLHFHASAAAVRGIFDFALVTNDQRLKQFAQDSYEFARQMGLHRLGLFPTAGEGTEGCTLGDMIGLAVALSDAGLGDYWDDVEMYARNGLLFAQATDMEELKRVSNEGRERPKGANWGGNHDTRFVNNNGGVLKGQEIHDRVLERSIGAFGHIVGARYQTPMMMHCCTANASQGLYYAWEGITRHSGPEAVVNLWLNRRSPWLDVWSWLPYEGKLVVQNKGMRRIEVRQPNWTRRGQITCQVNGRTVKPRWLGNRMIFEGLRGQEQLTITAPVSPEMASYTVVNLSKPLESKEQYLCEFKANTAINAQRTVPGQDPAEHNWYRLFHGREQFRAPTAPLKAAPAYVHPEKIVRWLYL